MICLSSLNDIQTTCRFNTVLLLVSTVCSIYVILKAIYNIYLHPLSSIPGPRISAASRIPFAISTLLGVLPYEIKRLHDIYGAIVRIAPNEVSFANVDAWTDIYVNSPSRPYMPKDPLTYQVSPQDSHNILTVPKEIDHSRYRRVFSYAFSLKAMREQESLIDRHVKLLVAKLKENASCGPQDILAWYNFTLSDLISDLSFGDSFGSLQKGEYHPWVSMLFTSFRLSTLLTLAGKFQPWTGLLTKLIPMSLKREVIKHDGATRDKIQRRITTKTDRIDMMNCVLAKNEHGKGLSNSEIQSSFHVILGAGLETTSTLLVSASYLLLQNPACMQKLKQELCDAFESEAQITPGSTNKLKYLRAVLDEAMRILPPTPWGSPRVVPGIGETICGHWISGGTVVNIWPYNAYHMQANFRDPDCFVPERWLNDPKFDSDIKGVFQPFSVGPRNCIGRSYGYAEAAVIMARVLWNFDIALEDVSRDWLVGLKAYTFWEKPPLYVTLNPIFGEK